MKPTFKKFESDIPSRRRLKDRRRFIFAASAESVQQARPSKRTASILQAVLLLAVLVTLAACAPTPKAPAAPVGAATGQDPQEKITLRFVTWDGADSLKTITDAVAEFEQAHPHIDVRVEQVTANFQEKLLAQVAANVAPDVAQMGFGEFQRFSKRGALLPLDDFIARDPNVQIEDYYPEIIRIHSYNNQLFVLPRDIAPIGIIYYNKDLFREAGVPLPKNTLKPDGTWDPKANWTWDFRLRPELGTKDFFTLAQKLTKTDPRTGRVTQWGYMPGWGGILHDMFTFSTGARYTDDPEDPTKILVDDPRVIRAFQWAADLAHKKRLRPTDTELATSLQTSARQLFTQGRVAMFQSGIWEVPNLRAELWDEEEQRMTFEWDIAMAPAFADGSLAIPTGGSGYAVMSQTKHPEEAYKLVAWLAGRPGIQKLAETGLAQPAIRDMAKSAPWIPDDSVTGQMRYPENRIITHLAVPFVVAQPTSMFWGDVSNVLWQNVGRIQDGLSPASVELKISAERGQRRLDTLRKEENLPPFNWVVGWTIGALGLAALAYWILAPDLKQNRTPREKKEARIGWLFVAPWVLGLLVFTAGPMALSFMMAFSEWDIIRPARFRGLQNFAEAAFIDDRFWKSIVVTTVYTVVAVPLGLALSLGIALLLNVKVKGMALFRTLYYLPSLASAVATALIWQAVFRADGGLLNLMLYSPVGEFLQIPRLLEPIESSNGVVNWLGNEQTALASLALMGLWGAGGGMVILLAALQGVPQLYYEAATLDGASAWQRFKAVTVPMISPALFFSLLTGFIGSFQSFASAFLMTAGGPNDATMFYILNLYNQAFLNLRMGYASALAWILFVIILVVTLFQLRLSKYVYYEGAK